jgi:putative two-component system response regulator
VKEHTTIGSRLLTRIYERTPDQTYLKYAKLMAEGHHERYDGLGYPRGLAGVEIPLCCRLMSVANVYDACLTERVYRKALKNTEAYDIVMRGKGTEFDPSIVEAFDAIHEKFEVLNATGQPVPAIQNSASSRLKPMKETPKEILVVDDQIPTLKQIGSFLTGSYNFSLAKSGSDALSICAQGRPDLILLDVEMPEMNGFEVIERLRQNPALSRIPVIFLTGNQDTATEVRGLQSGARDFIKKPAEKNILLHRIALHLSISSYQMHLADSVTGMSDSLATSIAELIECRDESTGGHVVRTSKYVELLGRELLERGLFVDELSGPALSMIVRAAPLHDIGKISISDRILLKPARLSDEEFAAMKEHAILGAQIVENMYVRTPTQTYLRYAAMIAASHHERYDGTGYPNGWKKDVIPICGRIMAVADVYDALVENRVYRRAMSHVEAYNVIIEGQGTQFDPRVIEAFKSCHLKFAETFKSADK